MTTPTDLPAPDESKHLLARFLMEEVGAYSVQCATTGELAPSKALVDSVDAIDAALTAQAAEIDRLRALLQEAADEVQDWGSYASEYMQTKHDLAGAVAKLRAAAVMKDKPHG